MWELRKKKCLHRSLRNYLPIKSLTSLFDETRLFHHRSSRSSCSFFINLFEASGLLLSVINRMKSRKYFHTHNGGSVFEFKIEVDVCSLAPSLSSVTNPWKYPGKADWKPLFLEKKPFYTSFFSSFLFGILKQMIFKNSVLLWREEQNWA